MDLQTVHKKKQPSKFAPIQQSVSHFFSKSVKKLPPESNIQSSEAETKISASSLALEKVDFIKDCPVFSSSDPRFGYDIVLAVGKRNQLSDGVKYQVLTSRDYLPEKFEYPQSLTTDFKKYRRCIVELLNKFEFLRYCVNCVLFSNSTEKRKTPLRAREI